MSELSALMFGLLQVVFWIVLIVFGFSWLVSFLFPKNRWLKKMLRSFVRGLFKPIQALFRSFKWLIYKAFTTRPDFNRRRTVIEDCQFTPLELFDEIEEVFQTRHVDRTVISRIKRREWHLLSTSRTYLLISFRQSAFIISAVVLGTSLLITERFTRTPSRLFLIILQVPVLGAVMEHFLVPPTFYREDIYYAFEQSVRSSLREATDLLDARELGEPNIVEQQPVLEEFYE